MIPIAEDASVFSTWSINSSLKIAWYSLFIVKKISEPFSGASYANVGSAMRLPNPFLLKTLDPVLGSKYLLYWDSNPTIPISSTFVKPTIWPNKFSSG